MPSSAERINQQSLVPSEMRSAEWQTIDAWLRERAFFMATVSHYGTLAEFRKKAAAVAAGGMGAAEARQLMRDYLAEQGYQALPGLEGSIKDLSSTRRLKVSIDTNVQMAQGWAQRQENLGDVMHPAQELFRSGQARVPRDWASRWQDAAEAVDWEGVARNGEMIALTISPIWAKLSRFGNPYPPFDYGSHMRLRLVDIEKCMQIGLVADPKALRDQMRSARQSFNEGVEASVREWPQDIRKAVEEQMGGLVRLDEKSGALLMTDPNGTTPYSPEQIGKVITGQWPEYSGVPHLQAKAYRDWVEKSSRFDPPRDGESPVKTRERVSLNEKEDLIRLFHRIESSESETPIMRSLHWASASEMNQFEHLIDKRGYYSSLPGKVADSFSTSEHNAEHYANMGAWQAQIICVKHKNAKDLRPLYNDVMPSKQIEHHPVRLEAEFVVLGNTRLHVVRKEVRRWEGGGRTIYYVEER